MRKNSVLIILLAVAAAVLTIIALRGTDYGPLHIDVMQIRNWYRALGIEGFTEQYFDGNQRHPLVPFVYNTAYSLFGENNTPYNLIFMSSRLLNGVLLGLLMLRISGRQVFSLCAGLLMMAIPLRVPQLFQGVNWLVEPTLTLLLASTLCYIACIDSRRLRWLYYALSCAIYIFSIYWYEAGLPWVGVNLVVGVLLRDREPLLRRALLALRDAIIPLIAALILVYIVLFVWEPWEMLAPGGSSIFGRALAQIVALFTFPQDALMVFSRIAPVTLLIAALAGAALTASAAYLSRPATKDNTQRITSWPVILGFGLVMYVCGLLVALSSSNPPPEDFNRISQGRLTGQAVLIAGIIFAGFDLLRFRWRGVAAAGVLGGLLIGPGFAGLFTYQNAAYAARADVARIADAIAEIRWQMNSPVQLVIITERDWSAAYFPYAAEYLLIDLQQLAYERSLAVTIDLVHTGGFTEEYATHPDSCAPLRFGSHTVCLAADEVHNSFWATTDTTPYDDIVVMRWNHVDGTLAILRDVAVNGIGDGYNLLARGQDVLSTNPERLEITLP